MKAGCITEALRGALWFPSGEPGLPGELLVPFPACFAVKYGQVSGGVKNFFQSGVNGFAGGG